MDNVADKFSKHLATLSKRGRHRVLVGDLDYAGLPGKIYTPAEGNGLPAVVFAHDWLKDISVYHATLRHLASWGFVVAAPNTEKGFSPNHRGFAADIETSLQILTGVKLGSGNITVAPGRLGIVGHGMGAGAAVLAATNRPQLAAVAALYPSQTTPSAEVASRGVEAPGLVVGTEDNALFDYGNAAKLAANWKGDVAYREIDGASHNTITEDTLFKLVTGQGRSKAASREKIRGLVTGFLLHRLSHENKYSAFSEPEAESKKITSYWGDALEKRALVTADPEAI
nr:dienelactone hydrolase family protein [Corynebacterium ulcerans]